MELPSCLATSVFEHKGLYYFTSEHLNTDDPHYFLIAMIDGQLLHLVVCTKQFEKRAKYIEITNADPATLVRIKPSADNELKLESYIDCNKVFSDYTIDVLEEKLTAKVLKLKGYISDAEFYNVLNGILKSNDVDGSIKVLAQKVLEAIP
jgi:hypothetical protein